MGNKFHAMHGRDHLPGGADPIPTVAAAGGGDIGNQWNYSRYGLEMAPIVANGRWDGASDWNFQTVHSSDPRSTGTVTSANAPYGAYFELIGQNSYLMLGFPLAPRYSVWRFEPVYSIGPDCGIVSHEWQTTQVPFAPGSYHYSGLFVDSFPQWAPEPPNPTNDTNWYKSDTRYQYDAYAGSAGIIDTNDLAQRAMYLNGAAGSNLAADATSVVYTTTHEFVAGADGSTWWWVRMKTKTKNGSSSAYTMRIHGWSMYRLASDILTPN